MTVIHSTASPSDVRAMAEILDRLFGTQLERDGDIVFDDVPGYRLVISKQDGGYHAASVDRS